MGKKRKKTARRKGGQWRLFCDSAEFLGRQGLAEPHDAQELGERNGRIVDVLDHEVGIFPAVEQMVCLVVLQQILDFVVRAMALQQVLDDGYVVGHDEDGEEVLAQEAPQLLGAILLQHGHADRMVAHRREQVFLLDAVVVAVVGELGQEGALGVVLRGNLLHQLPVGVIVLPVAARRIDGNIVAAQVLDPLDELGFPRATWSSQGKDFICHDMTSPLSIRLS